MQLLSQDKTISVHTTGAKHKVVWDHLILQVTQSRQESTAVTLWQEGEKSIHKKWKAGKDRVIDEYLLSIQCCHRKQ